MKDLDLLVGSGEGRGAGLHASDIYNGLYARLDPKRYGGHGAPPATKMAMGLAWEQYLEKVLVANGVNAYRPGEFTGTRGIKYSPDLLITNGRNRLGEIKLTFMAYPGDDDTQLSDPKFDKWKTQTKFYGGELEIPDTTFFVLFVNGDYRARRDPIFKSYDLTFTNQEQQETKRMLVSFAEEEGLL